MKRVQTFICEDCGLYGERQCLVDSRLIADEQIADVLKKVMHKFRFSLNAQINVQNADTKKIERTYINKFGKFEEVTI